MCITAPDNYLFFWRMSALHVATCAKRIYRFLWWNRCFTAQRTYAAGNNFHLYPLSGRRKRCRYYERSGCSCSCRSGTFAGATGAWSGNSRGAVGGPSFIILALMASGMNGQQFVFHGYIPVQQPSAIALFKNGRGGNDRYHPNIYWKHLIEIIPLCGILLSELLPTIRLCVAMDLTGNWNLSSPKRWATGKTFNWETRQTACDFYSGDDVNSQQKSTWFDWLTLQHDHHSADFNQRRYFWKTICMRPECLQRRVLRGGRWRRICGSVGKEKKTGTGISGGKTYLTKEGIKDHIENRDIIYYQRRRRF